jgi:hypothetical protein
MAAGDHAAAADLIVHLAFSDLDTSTVLSWCRLCAPCPPRSATPTTG